SLSAAARRHTLPLPLHDALPIWPERHGDAEHLHQGTRGMHQYWRLGRAALAAAESNVVSSVTTRAGTSSPAATFLTRSISCGPSSGLHSTMKLIFPSASACMPSLTASDRKSTRLNSSHVKISYAVF